MRTRSSLAAAIVVCLGTAIAPIAQAATGALFTNESGEPTLAPVIKEIGPAIVNIATSGTVTNEGVPADPFFGQIFPNMPQHEQQVHAVGSGVIVDAANGYIITNNHVIDGADEIMITLTDRRQFPATLVGTDPETDIAVLQVEASNLTGIDYGDSDRLEVGDFVIAVGNPFGLGQTVTLGIVSAKGRSGLGIEGYEDFIQTDASINPGNSGGALVSMSGRVIGINTAILGNQGNIGIGFAIPINMARSIMDQIIEHGSVQRGLLGVNIQDMTPDLAQALGVEDRPGALVARVFPDSAAKAAGVEDGDIITAVNGVAIDDASDLRNVVGLMRVGETAELTVLRGERELSLDAVIQARPEEPQMASAEPAALPGGGTEFAGAAFGPIDPQSEMSGKVDGVEVVDVQPQSKAWAAGLRPGDVVTEVNRDAIANPDQFSDAIDGAEGRVLLHVRRGDAAFYVLI